MCPSQATLCRMNLTGKDQESVTFKTGCSASMISLDTACKALARGDCESAIVGGTNLVLSPGLSSVMSSYKVNSADGRCRPFDASASGYGRGEAVSSLFIKRLDHALRDGNPIRGVIRSTLCNDDGKTQGITNPSSGAHEALIRATYAAAGLADKFHETGYFECHGTGTPTGDPVEAGAVARVFGKDGIVIGSVKSNVGHSESASGNTSIIKGILALEHRTIPPNVNFNTPNPKIPWKEAKLTVATEPLAWPADRLERVSVNSFGIGGSNAHVILESASFYGVEKPQLSNADEAPRLSLILLSAKNDVSLRDSVDKHAKYLEKHGPSRLRDLSYTLASRRDHHEQRTFAISDGEEPFIAQPSTRIKNSAKSLVFVFTGQGAQWAEMGKQLIDDFESVRQDILEMDKILSESHTPPSWNIHDELRKKKLKSQLSKAEFSQPLCTVVQVAIVNLLRTWGVTPAAVAGHSSGEIAAAYATGTLTKREAVLAAYFRGFATKEKLADGAMAAVGLGADQVRPYLTKGVVVACENSPSSTTISGDREAVECLITVLQRDLPEVFVRALQVDNAYHSHHMQAYGDAYEDSIKYIESSGELSIPFFSSVTGKIVTACKTFDAAYWRSNLESPVLFSTAITNIIKAKFNNPVVLEIGPHSALAGPLRQIFQAENTPFTYISSLQRGKDSTESIYTCIGNLWANNFEVNFDAINPVGNVLTDLPAYSWDHAKSFWKESRFSKEWRNRKFIPHETLGVQLPGSSHLEPTWRNILTLEKAGWIRDHKVGTDIVFPGAGYVCMAGEAIRQLTGRSDYSVRGLSIRTAMLVNESKENDLVTTFKKAKLTTTDDSDWWEFRITSFNGSTWNEHCSGQAKAGPIRTVERDITQVDHLRKVSASRWYNTFQKIGFTYGPSFRGLRDISVDPISLNTVASIDTIIRKDESFYELHPSELDRVFQLLIINQHEGDPNLFKQLSMPTYIDEVYISGGATELKVTATSTTDHMNAWSGNAFATSNGKLVFELNDLRVSAMGTSSGVDEKPKNAVELVWKPDIDFLDATGLIGTPLDLRHHVVALEKYFFLLATKTVGSIADIDTEESHLVKFRSWLNRFVESTSKGGNKVLPEGKELAALSREDRESLLKKMTSEFESTPVAGAATALRRVHESAKGRWEGTSDTLEVLMEGGILTQIYAIFDNNWDYAPLLQSLGHNKPTLRVLEIGAGTGGTTKNLLDGLKSEFGERLYSKYSYTDVSSGFFVAAKERFKDYQNIEFSLLDISKDPLEQGFEEGGYDLILAANVLHATPYLTETLKNVRKLLSPNGRLLLQELDMQASWMGYIMGGFPGWWLGDVDGRPDEPFVSPKRWDLELKASGFSGFDALAYDNDRPYQVCATMVCRVAQPPIDKKGVTFLYRNSVTPVIQSFSQAFEQSGNKVQLVPFGEDLPVGQDIISFLELESPFLNEISQPDFERWMKVASNLDTNSLVWLTHPSSMGVKDPRYAQALGFARTLRSEKHSNFHTLEIDDFTHPKAPEKALQIYTNAYTPNNDLDIDPDYEFVLQDGVIYSSRYHWFSVRDGFATSQGKVVDKVLKIGQKGMVDSLRWEENISVQRSLKAGEVAVKPHTVGVNFKDLLLTQGVVDGDDLGCEASGTVLEVGPGVTKFAPGDNVFMVESYCFSNKVITSQEALAHLPQKLSLEGAATMPLAFATAIYALVHRARLSKGQTILIHSACGGVGIASIQIAQMVGAKVFATVGNVEKVKYLVDSFGIPRSQIFDSHSNNFLDDVLAATDGLGVDAALNSLAGELLHATWKAIAPFGAMIEIGKRDFYGHAKIDMFQFTSNREFIGVDIRHIQEVRPDLLGGLLRELAEYVEQGHVHPLQPIKTFAATEIGDAFRGLQKGTHIGKLTVRMPEDLNDFSVVARTPDLDLQPDASYFLVGGLGGVGRSIASWFVRQGAKHLIFLSRSGRSEKVEHFCQELEVLGCHVQVFKGSVANLGDVKEVVAKVDRPIRGVIQLSMALQDRAIDTMTYEDWYTAVRPKVDGTWNLHHALGNDLDFFVMFASTSGIMGQYGQANYAAANTLDAFTHYRHSLGLTASTIDLGVMDDVGFVVESASLIDYFKFLSANLLTEEDMLEVVRLAIARSSPTGAEKSANRYSNPSEISVGVHSSLPLSDPNNHIIWKRDRRFSVYRTIEATSDVSSSDNEGLKSFLNQISSRGSSALGDDTIEYLAKEIGNTLYGFMMQNPEDMQFDQPLSFLGLDSLVGIELRNWCRQHLELDISILEIMQSTLLDIGQKAVDSLIAKHA
ncbi:Highly reducing polyketide synthase FUM1 [Lachnellula suecica]|uniref:Highly reducing polyketide synthase FUM1 n=1 Tax=Lachnellula suecica TaxID=602035 RepID=A0A8T9CE81_9HELO|nr:Highly reducing polyketide synthase FUM1 [Lachnellula suecica]